MSCKITSVNDIQKNAALVKEDLRTLKVYMETLKPWKNMPERVRKAYSDAYFKLSEMIDTAESLKGIKRY